MKLMIFAASVAALALPACSTPPSPEPASSTAAAAPTRWDDVVQAISTTMRSYHYNPAELDTPAYQATEAQVRELALSAATAEDFVRGFNKIWREGPFSHVRVDVARASASDTAAYLDSMRVGGDGASLVWRDDVALLTVNTMMGADTIDQIESAFSEIARHGANGLIIDLRKNEGGAFAGIPLVGHTLASPYDAGVFVSQRWAHEMTRAPGAADIANVTPWTGWSITTFWRDVQDNRLTRIQFQPMAPAYAGPVFVLISKKTASAAEMAADAFKGSGRAILIGEATAGQMLSQKMYDLPQGLQLSLPIADYYSLANGRIEGAGVAPDIASPAADALDIAFAQIASGDVRRP